MRTAIEALLRNVLKAQALLGEQQIPVRSQVIQDFIQNIRSAAADLENTKAVHDPKFNDPRAGADGQINAFVCERSMAEPLPFPNNDDVNALHTTGPNESARSGSRLGASKTVSTGAQYSVGAEINPNEPSDVTVDLQQSCNAMVQPDVFTLPVGPKEMQWEWLKQRVLSSEICLKHVAPGKKLVFGSGNLNADVFFCGEAPGATEEEQGEVFVGRAGQLLTKIIEATGLKRSDVYIGNIMNWRPETPDHIGNRPPTQEEMQWCLPYLIGQIDIVKPKLMVALGATAVNGLLGYDAQRRMRDCRGRWFEFNHIPMIVTYHPSYLLRNATQSAKRLVWEDMLQMMTFLKLPISERQKRFFL